MARQKTPEQRAFCIQRIIDLTQQYGRLTVKEASAMLGLYRGTTEKYFHQAAARGGLIRHGRCGLFRDQRAVIDYDLQRYSSNRAYVLPPLSISPVMGRTLQIYGVTA